MNDLEYQRFLDWLRQRDRVVLRLEDGTVLAAGFRARTLFEEHDAAIRTATNRRAHIYTFGYLRKTYGEDIDVYLSIRPSLW